MFNHLSWTWYVLTYAKIALIIVQRSLGDVQTGLKDTKPSPFPYMQTPNLANNLRCVTNVTVEYLDNEHK